MPTLTALGRSMPVGVLITAVLFVCLSSERVSAQPFDVTWYTVDGGGEMFSVSSGQTYVVSGTIGQPDAGESTSASYTVKGGFWPAPEYVRAPIPAVSEWGLWTMLLLVLTAGTLVFKRARHPVC